MAKFSFLKRIIKEDFPEQYRDLIDKLAYPFNQLAEFISLAFNNNITFQDNIYCQVKDVDVELNSSGIPKSPTKFISTLRSKSNGLFVIRADNLTNPNTYPTNAPFISFTENSNIITVNKVTGLQANNKYRLKVISIG